MYPKRFTTISIACRVDLVVDALDFERVEEALHRGVVEAVALAAHGRRYPSRGKDLAIAVGSVLGGLNRSSWPTCVGRPGSALRPSSTLSGGSPKLRH